MENYQYATPILIRNGETIILQRVPFGEKIFNEGWLQSLLFENPTILPFSDLEPAFDGAGPVDLMYMNSKGYITLVETKLWRNPEARRSVIAQVIDYAKDIAEWSYDLLIEAIRKSNLYKNNGDPLIDLFSETEGDDFNQIVFIDRVTRNLQKGRFLLLIVGDGIQEGVEKMANFLQQTPYLGYSLALVELAVYRESPERKEMLYIQPKILVRTKEITRAIVELKIPASRSDVTVSLPTETSGKTSSRKRITEEEFLEELQESSGDNAVQFAKWVLDQAEEHDLWIDWKDAGPLLKYDDSESGDFFTLGQLHKTGNLTETSRLYSRFHKLGWPFDACFDYFDEVAALIPGASRKSFTTKSGRKKEQIELLEPVKEGWFDAIDKLVNRIKALSGDQE
jgi:hypothetical protein